LAGLARQDEQSPTGVVGGEVWMGSGYVDCSGDALLKPEWLQSLRDMRFLTRCRTGVVSPTELHLFVRQHYHYSKHFTRYLCGLLSNLHDELDRAALTRNLFDEMGMSGGVSHTEIYRRMMAAMLPYDDGAQIQEMPYAYGTDVR
jgi:sugar (pentulose or hexulose) kinase